MLRTQLFFFSLQTINSVLSFPVAPHKVSVDLENVYGSASRLHARREATFGMGCFWKPSEEMLKVDGVLDTVVGYTGNPTATKVPPSYDDVCFSRDWVEAVRVYYDDSVISFSKLLESFEGAQEPKPGSRQYASIVFVHDSLQERAYREWMEAGDATRVATTSAEKLTTFYAAEGYHQRYWQKQRPRLAALLVLVILSSWGSEVEWAGALTHVSITSSTIHNFVNALILALGLFQLLERGIDSKVEELR